MKGQNVEIRAATESELVQLRRLDGYAFAINTDPKEPQEPDPLQAEQTLCAFVGERMVATSGAFPFRMRFNGNAIAADGVTAVAADPGYRRQGIVRELITQLLRRSRDNDVPLSILWASMGAIYQRFGYGLATSNVGYDIRPENMVLQFGEEPAGVVRLMEGANALEALNSVYRQYASEGTCLLHRHEIFWELMLRRQNNQNTYIAVYFDSHDTPRGYCLYRTRWQEPDSPEPSQRMDVFDFAWLDMDAWRGIWSFLGSHDLVSRVCFEFVAEDDPAPDLLLEPRMLRRRTWDGIWLRVVDAEKSLSIRGYDSPGEVTIAVRDDLLCEWNNGRYRVASDGRRAEVSRLADGDDADIIANPNALASLLSGHARVSHLARIGRLQAPDADRWAEFDQVFSTRRRPTCPNMF
jgi:predicted acetyltransferase